MLQTAKLSVEEYHRIVAAGILRDRQIELLEGELIELSPETPYHANRNHTGYKYLLSLFGEVADVRSGHPITLATSEPQPDIVLAQLPETRYDNKHPEPDDIYLLIEVSFSTLDYDLGEKKRVYAKAKIAEYWVTDLKNRRLIVFREPVGDDYRVRLEFTGGVVSAIAFPGIGVEVGRLVG